MFTDKEKRIVSALCAIPGLVVCVMLAMMVWL